MFRSCNFRSSGGLGPLPISPQAGRSFLHRSSGFFLVFSLSFKNPIYSLLSNFIAFLCDNFFQILKKNLKKFLRATIVLTIVLTIMLTIVLMLTLIKNFLKFPKYLVKCKKQWYFLPKKGPKKDRGLSVFFGSVFGRSGPAKIGSVRAVFKDRTEDRPITIK